MWQINRKSFAIPITSKTKKAYLSQGVLWSTLVNEVRTWILNSSELLYT